MAGRTGSSESDKTTRDEISCEKSDNKRQCPLSIILQQKTSDPVRTSDPHESGEATKAGHELEAAGQKSCRADHGRLGAKPSHATSLTWTCHPRRQNLQHWTGPNGGRNCSPYAPLGTRRISISKVLILALHRRMQQHHQGINKVIVYTM